MSELACIFVSAAILAALLPCVSDTNLRAQGLKLAIDGRPRMTIVLADGAIPAERTAADELASYLGII